MMRLDLMKRFFDSVDDNYCSPIADSIAKAWFDDSADVRVLRASANFVCVATNNTNTYFLRFNHESERTPDSILAELAFLDGLSAHSIRLAHAIPSRSGSLLESTQTPLGLFHAVLFEALPGEEREFDDLSDTHFESWGQALGELHAASSELEPINRSSWVDRLDFARNTIPHDETLAWRELHTVAEQLADVPRTPQNSGLIHYDFELDNLKWQDGSISILDFDDCMVHWYVADIAYALRDLYGDSVGGIDLNHPSLRAFVRGYRTAKPLADEELERLPLLLRLHSLIAFARITRSLGDGPHPHYPEWTKQLYMHLDGILDGYRQDYAQYPMSPG